MSAIEICRGCGDAKFGCTPATCEKCGGQWCDALRPDCPFCGYDSDAEDAEDDEDDEDDHFSFFPFFGFAATNSIGE